MIIFYLITGIILLVISALFLALPQKVRIFVKYILDRELYILPGLFEVGIGLGTLYFRNFVACKSFALLIGFLMFFDGILYLAAPKQISRGYEWILERDENSYRIYGAVLMGVALGYVIVAFL